MEEESLIVINVSGIHFHPSLTLCSPEWRGRTEDLERPSGAETRCMLSDNPQNQKCLWVEGSHRGKQWMWLTLQTSQEHLILIKTRKSLFEEVEQVVKSLHPYEVPEIVGMPASNVNTQYMKWVLESTKAKTSAQQ